MTNVQVYPSCSVTVAAEPFCTQVQASDSSPSQIVPLPPALKVAVICTPMAAGSMVWPFAEACVSTHWPSKLPVAGAVPPVEGSRPSGSSPPPGAFVACGAAAVCVKYMATPSTMASSVPSDWSVNVETSPVSWLVIVTVLPACVHVPFSSIGAPLMVCLAKAVPSGLRTIVMLRP